MKKIVAILAFVLAICGFTFAQSPLVELDKVKEIKLLESTRDDVVKILANDIFPVSDSSYYQYFYTEKAVIAVYYSSGNCSKESEDWNAAEWKVTEVRVSPKDPIEIKNIGIDYSKFRKEALWGSIRNDYAYHDKSAGIAITATDDLVDSIIFLPSARNYSQLCEKEEVKKYYSSKKWNRYPWLKKAGIDVFPPANVVGLDLSQNEIIIGCDLIDTSQNKSCPDSTKEITVFTTVVNPMNSVLVYAYYISGGKIVGQGRKVVWDLSGVKAGTYKITAVADDGCGPCGKYITKTVVVKDCPDCSIK